jgi:hypothetical protein
MIHLIKVIVMILSDKFIAIGLKSRFFIINFIIQIR